MANEPDNDTFKDLLSRSLLFATRAESLSADGLELRGNPSDPDQKRQNISGDRGRTRLRRLLQLFSGVKWKFSHACHIRSGFYTFTSKDELVMLCQALGHQKDSKQEN